MVIFTIIGSIIGAGFASGQEIYLFFYKYGIKGIYGLILCSFFISLIIYKSLKIIYENNVMNYLEFLKIIFKSDIHNKYLNLSFINNVIINLFLLVTFFVMVAGFGAFFEQEIEIRGILGASILAISSYFIFKKNMNGITKINSIAVPILLIIILILGLKNINCIENIKFIKQNDVYDLKWIYKAIIYASYNIILLIPVLVNLKNFIKNKKHIWLISFFSGLIFFILAICVFLIISNVDVPFEKLQMPTIYVVKKYFKEFKVLYGLVILISIFTTAISIGVSFLDNVCKQKNSYPQYAKIMCITSVFFSNFGFSKLVEILFPIFGFLGLLQIALIIFNSRVNKKNICNKH